MHIRLQGYVGFAAHGRGQRGEHAAKPTTSGAHLMASEGAAGCPRSKVGRRAGFSVRFCNVLACEEAVESGLDRDLCPDSEEAPD